MFLLGGTQHYLLERFNKQSRGIYGILTKKGTIKESALKDNVNMVTGFIDQRYKMNFYNAFEIEQALMAKLKEALKISLDCKGDNEVDNNTESAVKISLFEEGNHTASEKLLLRGQPEVSRVMFQ